MRFGVILASELVTKRLALSDMGAELYTVLHKGEVLYEHLTEEEYFDTMEDLSQRFYETGSPNPSELDTRIIQKD